MGTLTEVCTFETRQLYNDWGEIRLSGSLPTDYAYTGQYLADYVKLYWYNSRYYDPALGRWTQPDSIISDQYNPADWDRFQYVRSNPLTYIDPSGNTPIVAGLLLAIWFGFIPDYRGIQTAEKFVSNNGGDSIVVAAGIAVQSQWHTPLDDLPGDGGRGKAQVSDDQMPEYGLDGQDQTNPEVAVAAMASRIERIQDACSGCQGKDLLVAAALAQNGSGISQDMIEKAPRNDDGSVRWHVFFKRNYSFHSVSHPSAFAREKFTGLQFDVQLMLLLFLNDLRELHSRGWDLPYELTLEDLNEIEDEYVSRWDFYDK